MGKWSRYKQQNTSLESESEKTWDKEGDGETSREQILT